MWRVHLSPKTKRAVPYSKGRPAVCGRTVRRDGGVRQGRGGQDRESPRRQGTQHRESSRASHLFIESVVFLGVFIESIVFFRRFYRVSGVFLHFL